MLDGCGSVAGTLLPLAADDFEPSPVPIFEDMALTFDGHESQPMKAKLRHGLVIIQIQVLTTYKNVEKAVRNEGR